ncbi:MULTISPECIES: BlaI/MecI/CopY family transcriptional regulator [Sphingomonas]|uniref:BlaI/MecI/CopY family transcriptional regulator n=1 Tax=Sphingomonas TaxID=13687 RepID=UPI000DEFA7FB|nr:MULTISPECIES: BlaI/MecI/CopY family transcriptional regulator [Sphingomonas]
MLNRLPPKERQIVDLLYQRGAMTSGEVVDGLPERLSGSAVRTMLRRLEEKGAVRRTDSERGYLYAPAQSEQTARKSALSEVVRVFFDGSPTSAASALLGMSDKIDETELDALERMIAEARKAKGK